MALILPYPTYAPFAQTTVHSNIEHNIPHAGLLSNDDYLAGQIDASNAAIAAAVISFNNIAAVTAVLYTQNATNTASLLLTSAGVWVVRCEGFLHCSSWQAYSLTMDGIVVQTLKALGDSDGTGYSPFFGYATKTIASPYSFVCSIPTSPSAYALSMRIGIMAFKIA